MGTHALDDLRVIDISTSVAGAWCSRLLADFGAEVTIVEPATGHPLRSDATAESRAIGQYVLANKSSVVLDVADASQRNDLLALIRSADVLVSSYSPAELARLGLGYDELGNPSLAMAHITPHGMTGALSNTPGNAMTVAARSGWASINGDSEREPLKPSGQQVAFCAGAAAFSGILAALHHRRTSGFGQEIDIAELDVMVAAFAPALLTSQYRGEALQRKTGNDITTGPVPVADGHFALTISRAHFWRDAMNVLGLPDLAEDHRYDAGWYRQAHKADYVDRVQEQMAKWRKQDLFEELAARRVVAGPVLGMQELALNKHLDGRDFWVKPKGSPTVYPGAPFKMSETPWALRSGLGHEGSRALTEARKQDPPRAANPLVSTSAAPLSGLRGIVLTQAWAGAFCTEMLGFLGADIIQVEVRKRPDSWRGAYDAPMAPAVAAVPSAEHPWNCSGLYNSVNLNKRCITLDLQTPDGVAVYRALLPFADFVVENFSPRVLGNLGLDYAAMKVINPDVILCSLSAYGHDGPWANVPGIGGTIEPTSGMSSLLGYEGGPPINSGQMYPDAVAGLNGLAAILTALHHRDRTGEGQYIDLSMQEANLTFVGDAWMEFAMTGHQRPRRGNRHPEFAPHGVFPCAGRDQWIAIACETEKQWSAFWAAAGNTEQATDARFATAALRKANEDALEAAIAAWARSKPRDETVKMLLSAGVLAAPVLDAFEVAADAGLRARGMVVEVTHPEAGGWPQAVSPIQFSRASQRPVFHAPLHGQHSREVLADLLSWSDTEYEKLESSGVSGMGPPD